MAKARSAFPAAFFGLPQGVDDAAFVGFAEAFIHRPLERPGGGLAENGAGAELARRGDAIERARSIRRATELPNSFTDLPGGEDGARGRANNGQRRSAVLPKEVSLLQNSL